MDTILYPKALKFSIRIVKLQRYLVADKKEYLLSKQVLKSGTSIGANVAEAIGAISRADFSQKISIAYKESLETKYWLELLKETDLITPRQFQNLYDDCDELSRIMFKILKTTRIDPENSP
ncbi:MAG: four helix bundle protein [Ignavibacteriaceae bacterium]|nr:four helix bundle protein [Ignavibacteriaceae bacterium]